MVGFRGLVRGTMELFCGYCWLGGNKFFRLRVTGEYSLFFTSGVGLLGLLRGRKVSG